MRIAYRYYDPAVEDYFNTEITIEDGTWQQSFDHCLKHLPMDHIDYLEFNPWK
jgi:hypothetical protein